MTESAGPDAVRADVERRLRAAFEAAVSAPISAARVVDACVRRRIETTIDVVGRPLQFVKSLLDLLVTPAESVLPTEPVAPIDTDLAPGPDIDVAAAPGPDTTDLPIEEYESLAASHVVARLDGLAAADLRRVRRFEAAHRGRRTVLGKVDQLLGE